MDDKKLDSIIFDPDFWPIFKNNYNYYHARIKNGYIAKFYLSEYLKFNDDLSLYSIKDFNALVNIVEEWWLSKIPRKYSTRGYDIMYRGGKLTTNILFFSDHIEVAALYRYPINAYYPLFDESDMYIIGCNGSYYLELKVPDIMQGFPTDQTVDTDLVAEYIKKNHKEYKGVLFMDILEGNDATKISDVYAIFDQKSVMQLTNY